jgi:ribokinase
MLKKIVMLGSYVTDVTGISERLPKAGETVFGNFFKTGPGGKGSNQMIAAHRAGAKIDIITKLGDDPFGREAIDFFKSEKVNTEHILLDQERATGIALICVDESTKQNQILVVPGACNHITPDDIAKVKPMIERADILLMQFEINEDALRSVMEIAKNAGVKVVLNPAPARESLRDILVRADIITPNEHEAETFCGVKINHEADAKVACDAFHQMGIPSVVITMGDKGVFVSEAGKQSMVPARKVQVVDTTGAGDAFNGGFITALAEGRDLIEAAAFGNALASLSVQKFGTAPSMPMRQDIDAVLYGKSEGRLAPQEVASYIDHTLLKPEATASDIHRICEEAKQYRFASVCVNPSYIEQVAAELAGTTVTPCCVVGFPLGSTPKELKAAEALLCVKRGAQEIDMVMNIGAMKSGKTDEVEADIAAVVDVVKGQAIVKVILETCLLTDEEKQLACDIAKRAGAQFVKTSTGFSKGGATPEDIRLMRGAVGPHLGVKASGGVKTYLDAIAMIHAGANRIGTSSGIEIVSGSANEARTGLY